jgi:hypothetical protein
MTIQLCLVALIAVSLTVVIVSLATTAIPALTQNMTSGNTTGENSTESLTTSEERGAYSEYGGGG